MLARAQQLAPTINQMIEEYEDPTQAKCIQIQALGAELRSLIKSRGLSEKKLLLPHALGTHPANRNYIMLDPFRVHELLWIIVNKGFAWTEVLLAMAGEIPPGSVGDEWRAKNEELAKLSGGMLPPANSDRMEAVTVVCSHTVGVLRIVTSGKVKAIHGKECLAGPDGFISKERVLEMCPTMQEPLESGFRIEVVRHELISLCPKLMEILAEADNAKHDTFRKESHLQIMSNLHRRSVATPLVPMERLMLLVGRAHCDDFKEVMPPLAEFVQNYSGGDEGKLLKELDIFMKSLNPVREVSPQVFGDLGKLKLSRAPLYVHALAKATLCAPDKYVGKNNLAKVFDSRDFTAMTNKKKDDVLRANRIMLQALDFQEKCGLADEPMASKIRGNMDVRLVMHNHAKSAPNRVTFKAMNEISIFFYKELCDQFPKARDIPCPWSSVALASASASEQPSNKGVSLMPLVIDVAALEKRGYVVKKVVQLRKDKTRKYVIKDLDNNVATLKEEVKAEGNNKNKKKAEEEEENDDCKKVVSFECLHDEYEIAVQITKEFFTDFVDFAECKEIMMTRVKGEIQNCLLALYANTGGKNNKNLVVQTKPTKKLCARKDIKQGALLLAPMSTIIGLASTPKEIPNSAITIGQVDIISKVKMYAYIVPKVTLPKSDDPKDKDAAFIVPYWFALKSSPAADTAPNNMSECHQTVTINVTMNSSSQHKVSFDIPLLKNINDLAEGEEIVYTVPSSSAGSKRDADGIVKKK